MNLVQLQKLDYNGSLWAEWFFYTDKPKEWFCDNNYNINNSFLSYLKENHPDYVNGNLDIKVFYHDKLYIEKI